MKTQLHYITHVALTAVALLMVSSCSNTEMSNKEERNAIRHGNKMYEKNHFKEAVDDYNKAIKANPASDAAFYNRSLAALHMPQADSSLITQARNVLDSIATNGMDPAISERSLYNLGCDAVYMGDFLKEASENPANVAFADSMKQMSTACYKKAIDYYETLLRKKPNNVRAVQNLRIAQLKLPPEDQNQNQNQQQQQQEQQQQQQQQQQQPQPQEQKQNQSDKQVLQSIQAKENKTRKEQPAEPANVRTTDKPW